MRTRYQAIDLQCQVSHIQHRLAPETTDVHIKHAENRENCKMFLTND
jgi:hypothetical protein